MLKLISAASLLALATVPNAALAEEVSGMVSVNTSQLFKDGFRPGGDHPTVKVAVTVPVADGLALEGFANKEFGGTRSDEVDAGGSYTFQVDDQTSVRVFASYYWMRELPDIIDTTVSVTHGRATVSATHYTVPRGADGYRLEANYRLKPTKRVAIDVGFLHEGGLGLSQDVNAVVIGPSIELGSNLFLDGRVVVPINGDPTKAALSVRFTF